MDFSNVDNDALNLIRRKLIILDSVKSLEELKVISNNQLTKLDEIGENYYSISVNDEYQIILEWIDGDAYNVEATKKL